MKKIYLIAASTLGIVSVFGQIGINTTSPNTTMDVQVKRDSSGNIINNSLNVGLQAPRITRAELTATTAVYGTDQIGAIIYITDITGGDSLPSSPRKNINAIGYYNFDGTNWIKMDTSLYHDNGTIPAATTRTVTLGDRSTSKLTIGPINEQPAISTLNVIGGNFNDITSGISIASNYADFSLKSAVIKAPQYDISNPPVQLLSIDNTSTAKTLYIGGRPTASNQASPNNIYFQVSESSDLTTSTATGNSHIPVFIKNTGAVGISTTTPTSALDVNGYVKLGSSDAISDAGTAALRTGSIRYIAGSGVQYYNGSAWIPTTNIYNSNGTLTGNRTVTQGANTLSFAGTAVNAFSVAGSTFSVDASNGRVGVGTATPQKKLHVVAGNDAIRIESLAQGTLPNGILNGLIYTPATGDVNYLAISSSYTTPPLAPGQSATFTDTSGIPSGSFSVETSDACGNMLSDYDFTSNSLLHLGSLERAVVGVATRNDIVDSSDWTVTFSGVISCGDGGDGTQFNYRIAKPTPFSYTITNLGNLTKTYELNIQR